eukprot:403536_1
MGCCCGGLNTSGSLLVFNPQSMSKTKPGQQINYSGMIMMALYNNHIAYDGCTCCCGCQDEIAFSNIRSLNVSINNIVIQTNDGWRIQIGPLRPNECNMIKNTYNENKSLIYQN